MRELIVDGGTLRALPEWFGELTSLSSLSIVANRLTGLSAQVAKLTKLRTLVLSQNALDSLPSTIGALKELRVLGLAHNPKLTSLPLTVFSLKALRQLDLTNTGISDLPPELRGLTALMTLKLEKTPLAHKRAARDAVKALFPQARWVGATLEIPRPTAPKQKPLKLPRAVLVKQIQSEQLADGAIIEAADLSGATFSSVVLNGQHFQNANLKGSTWRRCVLSVSFDGANIQSATFEDCVIEGDFKHLTWNRVDARGATFRRCKLVNVGFERADFRGARVELAPVDYGPRFSKVNGEGLILTSDDADGVAFDGGNFRRAVLSGRFEDARGVGASFVGADVRDATFPYASFAGADFTDAQLGRKTLVDAEVDDAVGIEVTTAPKQTAARAKRLVAAQLCVASEGGPLLVCSPRAYEGWGGAIIRPGEREDDYARLLPKLRGAALLNSGRAFWAIDPGVYDVQVSANRTEVVMTEGGDDDALVPPSVGGQDHGQIAVKSGQLVLAWAPVADAAVRKGLKQWSRGAPTAKLVGSNWALGVRVKAGSYRVTTGGRQGRRWCRLQIA